MTAAKKVLTEAQRELLAQVLDRIVPAGAGLPGAGEAGVAEFIESAVSSAPRQNRNPPESVRHSGESVRHSREGVRHSRESVLHSRESARHPGESIRHSSESIRHSGESIRHSGESARHSRESIRHSREGGNPSPARLLVDGLTQIEVTAARHGSGTFADLDADTRDRVLREVESSSPAFFDELVRLTYVGYYSQPRIVAALGLEARPPQPLGFDMQQGDLSLVENVRKRGPVYRKA